jgi:predicted dehydrogenase
VQAGGAGSHFGVSGPFVPTDLELRRCELESKLIPLSHRSFRTQQNILKMTIGIAILGAGIFAKEGIGSAEEANVPYTDILAEHLPAIQAVNTLSLKAIYSRSEKSATALAGSANVDAYFDDPSTPSKSLDDLLAREDIQAVVVALPILVQPDVIKKALAAGKHVLSEKPIAKDVATAQKLIEWHAKKYSDRIWSVAENFRFLEAVQFGADQVGKLGGSVTTFSMKLYGFVDENDKFFKTPW